MAQQPQQDWSHVQLSLPAEAAAPADYSGIQLDLNQQQNPEAMFNGLTSAEPLNKSDLTTTDAFNMGFGNNKGNIKYLQSLGHDAKLNKDGDLVYRKQDDKLWRYADQKGEWDLAESVRDVARAVPEIATFAAQTGATVLAGSLAASGIIASPFSAGATGAAGIAAAAAVNAGAAAAIKAASTSFGRLVNTYDDTPEGQLKDTAVEFLIGGLGGGAGKALELGMRPTARWIGNNLERLGENVSLGSDKLKAVGGFLAKVGLGVPDDAAEHLMTNAGKIGAAINSRPPGITSKALTESLDIENVGLTKKMSDYYQAAADLIYRKDKSMIVKQAEKFGLEFDPPKMADEVMEAIGPLFKWKVKGATEADGIIGNALRAMQIAKGDASRISVDLVDNASIAKIMEAGIAAGDQSLIAMGQLLSSETGRSTLHSGINRVMPNILSFSKKEGGKAAESFMEFSKLFKGQLWDMRASAVANDNKALASMFSGMNDRMQGVFARTLDAVTPDARFSKMNQTFRTMNHGLEMFSAARKAEPVDKQAFAKLYNQMKANSTLGTFRREALGSVDQEIAARMPHLAKRIESISERIDINLAAKHFAPWINPSIAKMAVGVGGGIGLATGDPSAAMGIGGIALLTSPRLAAKAFGAAASGFQGANSHIARQLAQSPDILKGFQITKGLSSQLTKSALQGANRGAAAEVLSNMLEGYIGAPQQQQQVSQQLAQPFEQINQQSQQRQQELMQRIQQPKGKR